MIDMNDFVMYLIGRMSVMQYLLDEWFSEHIASNDDMQILLDRFSDITDETTYDDFVNEILLGDSGMLLLYESNKRKGNFNRYHSITDYWTQVADDAFSMKEENETVDWYDMIELQAHLKRTIDVVNQYLFEDVSIDFVVEAARSWIMNDDARFLDNKVSSYLNETIVELNKYIVKVKCTENIISKGM